MTTAPADVPPHPMLAVLLRTTTTLLLLTVGYFALPFDLDWGKPSLYAELAVSAVALVGLFFLFRHKIRLSLRLRSMPYARVEWLLSALYLIILVFALTYAVIAVNAPEQFVELSNRMDALYFSVTLMATVGFGDVHPQGDFARALVTAHMLFNLIYIGTAVRLLTGDRAIGSTPGPGGP
jgi:voltage-gated potassium channel